MLRVHREWPKVLSILSQLSNQQGWGLKGHLYGVAGRELGRSSGWKSRPGSRLRGGGRGVGGRILCRIEDGWAPDVVAYVKARRSGTK